MHRKRNSVRERKKKTKTKKMKQRRISSFAVSSCRAWHCRNISNLSVKESLYGRPYTGEGSRGSSLTHFEVGGGKSERRRKCFIASFRGTSRLVETGKIHSSFLHPFTRWISCHLYFWKFCKVPRFDFLETFRTISPQLPGCARFGDSFRKGLSPRSLYFRPSFVRVYTRNESFQSDLHRCCTQQTNRAQVVQFHGVSVLTTDQTNSFYTI